MGWSIVIFVVCVRPPLGDSPSWGGVDTGFSGDSPDSLPPRLRWAIRPGLSPLIISVYAFILLDMLFVRVIKYLGWVNCRRCKVLRLSILIICFCLISSNCLSSCLVLYDMLRVS